MSPDPKTSARRPRDLEPPLGPFLLLFFLSGSSALVYEVIWVRLLALTFGITSYAVGTVLAAFMGGLALGSFLSGRVADRRRRHLRDYAVLEFLIGVMGILMPWLLDLVHAVAPHLVRGTSASYLSSAVTFLLSFLALLLPTTLMGATLPFLSKHVARNRETLGRRIGLLYALNTLGGMAGSFASAFLLIAHWGVRNTNLVAVGLNLVLAAFCLYLAGRPGTEGTAVPSTAAGPAGMGAARTPAAQPRRPAAVTGGPEPASAPVSLVLGAFALAGATSLAYEILLTRLLIFFLWDTTVYSFATMLTTFLAGLGIGSVIFSRVVDRQHRLIALFGMLEAGVGVSCLLLLPGLEHLSGLRWWLWKGLYSSGELATWRYLGLKFLMAFLAMILPTILMGGTFPVVNRIVSRDLSRLGRSVGTLYAMNTVGAIVGSILAGFWLVPALGLARGILAVAVVNGTVGLVLITRETGWSRRTRALAAAVIAILLLVGAALTPLGKPAVAYSDLLTNPEIRRELLYSKEGREATLAVLRDPTTQVLELNINGQSTAFTTYMDLQVHRALGHLPALCHPDPKLGLVIGFGFGSTCHSLLTHDLAEVDCVELVPDERETAPIFAEVNEDVLADSRFHFIPGDGRNHVLVTNRRYDVLSFNAIHPKLSASLYTLEFYKLCKSKLTPEGVIAAWLPVNFLSTEEFRMLIRTFQRVFPHTTLWFVGPGHVVLIGTPEPLVLDFGRIAQRLERPALREDLERSNLADPYEIVSMLVLDETRVATLAGEGVLNTDDRPRVEYGISFSSKAWYQSLQDLYRLVPNEPPPLTGLAGTWGDEIQVRERLGRYISARRYSLFGSIVQTIGLSTRNLQMIKLGIDNFHKAVGIAPESANTRKLLEDKEGIYRSLLEGGAPRTAPSAAPR